MNMKSTALGIRVMVVFVAIAIISAFLPIGIITVQADGLIPPEQLWDNVTRYDVTDISTGKLDINSNTDDVAWIDIGGGSTLMALKGEGDGSSNPYKLWDNGTTGISIAIGNIDADSLNEVVANKISRKIVAYENDGIFKWERGGLHDNPVDIEIGDINNYTVNDIVACGSKYLYAFDSSNGNDLPGWPINQENENFRDIALGNLDNNPGLEIAAIGTAGDQSQDCGIYVYKGDGSLLWKSDNATKKIQGKSIEIDDVNGDGLNEVVVGTLEPFVVVNGTYRGEVLVYKGNYQAGELDQYGDALPIYSFELHGSVADIELGELDGNANNGLEIACIDELLGTIYALRIDNMTSAPDSQILWSDNISWYSRYYGESIAIGDVDRDYKNEVIAAGSRTYGDQSIESVRSAIFVYDGTDRDGDKTGDLVRTPYNAFGYITDVEAGDLDEDGIKEVAFGTTGGHVVALSYKDAPAQSYNGAGDVYFDADPSTLGNLHGVADPAGKPANYAYPYGFFSFEITGLQPFEKALITITLPNNAPKGTQWLKYEDDTWTFYDIGDDDVDKIITVELTADENGYIFDPGAPVYPLDIRSQGVGGEVNPVNKITIILPLLALILAIATSGLVLRLRKRR
jgi:hypothetical protein